MQFEYKDAKNHDANEKVHRLLDDLPTYCQTFLVGREGKMSPSTRLTYMQRISKFFDYLQQNNSFFEKKDRKDISLTDLSHLEAEDIEAFASWIRHGGASNGVENAESSVNNYLSALNMFWRYFVSHGRLQHNPVANVERGGKGTHTIVRLKDHEEDEFMDSVAAGLGLTDHQISYHDKTAVRDTAICLTLMRTGLRVSELVGLNLKDVYMEEHYFHVIRKRSKEDLVFFDNDVHRALLEYLDVRHLLNPAKDENALFLVAFGKYQGHRLSVRSVQLLVKKYAKAGAPAVGSRITPHKLRATYATDMLKATGNVALVQEALNHESPTTTMMYADSRTMDLKRARNILADQHKKSGKTNDKGTIYRKDLPENEDGSEG